MLEYDPVDFEDVFFEMWQFTQFHVEMKEKLMFFEDFVTFLINFKL